MKVLLKWRVQVQSLKKKQLILVEKKNYFKRYVLQYFIQFKLKCIDILY